MDCSQITKHVLLDKYIIYSRKEGYLLLSSYSGKPLDLFQARFRLYGFEINHDIIHETLSFSYPLQFDKNPLI